jgi:hypothetical protein
MTLRILPLGRLAAAVGAAAVLAFAGACARTLARTAADDAAVQGAAARQEPPRDLRRTGTWYQRRLRTAALADQAPCPAVQAGQIYRFVAGPDACMAPMSADSVAAELNDAWAVNVLRPNAGGAGPWPDSVAGIVSAIGASPAAYAPVSYMVGEGSQIPPSVTPVSSARDLRYVVTFGTSSANPAIFVSARPAGVQGGTPPGFLQVISYDPQKRKYNYYQYVNNADVNAPQGPDSTRTWAWAGDSGGATDPQTTEQGCFQCHLNGGLNMKERTFPWNNWNSSAALIPPTNVPAAVQQDPLFQHLTGANQLETVFESAQTNVMNNWITGNVRNGTVSNVPQLLARLIRNTTVNFAATQVQSAGTGNVAGLPSEIFLPDSILSSVLGLRYSFPGATIPRGSFNAFVTSKQYKLVNTNGSPAYAQPGSNFFAGFVPVPSYEDRQAIRVLLMRNVVNAKFAGAVTMVDFTNPVFSPVRNSLQQYADQILTGQANGTDIPTRFAALAAAAAASQPACDTTALGRCTAEQQFLFYWNSSAWQASAQNRINAYFQALSARLATQAGQDDVMTLIVSRGVQFQNFWPICNLAEFSLLLPQTSLRNVFVQMNPDATLSTQRGYECHPGASPAPVAARAPAGSVIGVHRSSRR